MSQTQTPNDDGIVDDAVDLSLLSELGKSALVNALNSVNGAKTLVLDTTLAGPLGLLTEVSLLKIQWIQIIADQVKRLSREGQKHTFTLILVPRLSTLVTRILEEEGILGDITVSSFNLQFIPLENDVVSLENDNAFKEIWVDGDETVVYDSAQALITFQKLYGLFPRILGKGDCAARLTRILGRLLPTSSSNSTPAMLMTPSDKLDSLVILDRRIDMITPLLTQLTYEGLIDELIGVKNCYVELPASLLSPPPAPAAGASAAASSSATPSAAILAKEKKKKHRLTAATDHLFGEIRDLNFSFVGKKLNQSAHRLDEDYKSRLQAKTVAQLRDFVGKLGGLQNEHQSLRLHTGVSEMLVPMTRTEQFNKALEIQQNLLASYDTNTQVTAIEDLIAQGTDVQIVLRLLCLATLTCGGIKAKTLESLKRDILQTYGYDRLPLLLSLSAPSLGLLLPTPLPASAAPAVKLPYQNIRKALRLVIDAADDAGEPDDISYVYSGYAPLSVRLVQCVAQKGGVLNPAGNGEGEGSKKAKGSSSATLGQVRAHPIVGWKGFEDVLSNLPGETVDVDQRGQHGGDAGETSAANRLPGEKTTTTVVFFFGGCTYAEIAALRWVGRQTRGRRILIATTSITSGAGIMESISARGRANSASKEATL